MPCLPILRWGEPYQSMEQLDVPGCDGVPAGTMGWANPGLIRRDLRRAEEASACLAGLSTRRWLEIAAEAGARFAEDTLPCGDAQQTPEDWVALTARSTGLPHAACREHMGKLRQVLVSLEAVLSGLTRGLPLAELDAASATGFAPGSLRLVRLASSLGVVLPSNAPGVNAVWLPALALKVPVLLKPGRNDPWTPFRLAQAFFAAGCPRQAFGFYPSGHDGGETLLRSCAAGLVFGGPAAAARFAGISSVQVHGPGHSKVVIGADRIDRWHELLDVVVDSVQANAGRSCINASTVVVPSEGAALAKALGRRLGPLPVLPLDHEAAGVASFPDPRTARAIEQRLEAGLASGAVEDAAAPFRRGPRLVEAHGQTWLRPTVLRVLDPGHPLARAELPFVCVSVLEVPARELAREAAHSLVVCALSEDSALLSALSRTPSIGRLHAGPRPTIRIDHGQPMEGNLFKLLFQQRALSMASWQDA